MKYEKEINLKDKLKKESGLIVKLGFDPTSPDLHLGHYVVLRGAKTLQDMGHEINIIIGDFTASIGDPSGRNKLRPPLNNDEIKKNAETYMKQVFMILDEKKTKILKNSNWLSAITASNMLKLLSTITVSQILAREDFKKRFEDNVSIHLHELVYPLFQGLDSVKIKADIELGGSDQLFNLFMGRELQKHYKMEEQAIITFPLLVGLDGEKKMSKSLKNHIGFLDSSEDKFGKIMSISDETMWKYYDVLLEKTEKEINEYKNNNVNPKEYKIQLAKYIVEVFHGDDIANKEVKKFETKFVKKDFSNTDIVEFELDGEEMSLAKIIKDLNMASSISDAGRKIEQKGVKINEVVVSDKHVKVKKNDNFLLQVGKKHAVNLKFK